MSTLVLARDQPQLVEYTCVNITCDGYLHRWPVELYATGAPVDEAETRCPDCYSAGRQYLRLLTYDVDP